MFNIARSKGVSLPDGWEQIFERSMSGGTGGKSRAGPVVNTNTAMQLAVVQACIRVLCETMAATPMLLYRNNHEGDKTAGKQRAVGRTLYHLLRSAPNASMPAYRLRENMMLDLLTDGNAYMQIIRSRSGEPLELYHVPAANVTPRRDGNNIIYDVRTNDGQSVTLDTERMLHMPGMGYDGLKGRSPIRWAMDTIGMGLAAQQYGSDFFNSGGALSGVVLYPNGWQKEEAERFQTEWRKKYEESNDTRKTAFLGQGFDYKRIGVTPDEAQFLESRRFTRSEICGVYRVPPHMVGDLERATFSNIEQQALEFIMFTMVPWYARWEQYFNLALLSDKDRREGYYIEHLTEYWLRGDMESRAKRLHLMRQDGVINADEWRDLENMNPQEGGLGKAYLINGNMIGVEAAAAAPPRTARPNT